LIIRLYDISRWMKITVFVKSNLHFLIS
jgi:hypothetical protein